VLFFSLWIAFAWGIMYSMFECVCLAHIARICIELIYLCPTGRSCPSSRVSTASTRARRASPSAA
jgi:hypothetical protein